MPTHLVDLSASRRGAPSAPSACRPPACRSVVARSRTSSPFASRAGAITYGDVPVGCSECSLIDVIASCLRQDVAGRVVRERDRDGEEDRDHLERDEEHRPGDEELRGDEPAAAGRSGRATSRAARIAIGDPERLPRDEHGRSTRSPSALTSERRTILTRPPLLPENVAIARASTAGGGVARPLRRRGAVSAHSTCACDEGSVGTPEPTPAAVTVSRSADLVRDVRAKR